MSKLDPLWQNVLDPRMVRTLKDVRILWFILILGTKNQYYAGEMFLLGSENIIFHSTYTESVLSRV